VLNSGGNDSNCFTGNLKAISGSVSTSKQGLRVYPGWNSVCFGRNGPKLKRVTPGHTKNLRMRENEFCSPNIERNNSNRLHWRESRQSHISSSFLFNKNVIC
jgi:hypothetical protein